MKKTNLIIKIMVVNVLLLCNAFQSYSQSTSPFPGTALNFDGSNDYVQMPDDPTLDFTNIYLTIEAWIKADSWETEIWQGTIVGKDKNDKTGYNLRCGDNGRLSFVLGINNSWPEAQSSEIMLTNTWYHVCGVHDGLSQKIYINGKLVGEGTNGWGSIDANNLSLFIGNSPGYTDRLFDGKIEEVRIWNVVRDANQIRENMYLRLTGTETGLVSYWQFNEETGTTLSDIVGSNNGTLINMDNSDWITSTIPFGAGQSDTQTETAGTVDFTNTGLSMYYNAQNGAEITATRIEAAPNIWPNEPELDFSSQYWVVNRFGTGSFDTDITFTSNVNLSTVYESNPTLISLFKRGNNADENWTLLATASTVDAASNKVTFDGVTGLGQFIIGIIPVPEIILSKSLEDFSLIGNFNSIDVGYDAVPTFTDLDSDGLLDMIIGESYGSIKHYEQNAVNSTSFSLVTENFNSINVGLRSAPIFTDLDGNGLLDLIVGESDGNLNHYEQDGVNSTSFSLVTTNFNSIDVGAKAVPTFTDLDDDGLLDMIIGEEWGMLYYYEQDAVNSNLFSLVDDYFNSIDVGFYPAPTFTDLNDDGLLDMIIGDNEGHLNHYEQDGVNSTSFSLVTLNFNSIDLANHSTPTFIDLDGDGLLEIIIGESSGYMKHYGLEGVDTFSFGNLLEGNYSQKKYYLVANDLDSDLNIECPEGYKVSLSKSVGYVQSLSITPVNGGIDNTIYLRFEPDSTKEYSGNIAHTSSGAEQKNIAASGTGVSIDAIDAFPGTALDFDGINDYVEVPDNDNLNIADSLTIEAWIKADFWKANIWEGGIVVKEGNSSGYMLRCGDNGKVNFNIGTGAWNEITTDKVDFLSLNTWYHLAATYDGASQKIYINGKLVKEVSTSGDILANNNSLMIGTSPKYLDRTFVGKIEEVRIWNVARDSVQIRENMYLHFSGAETGLICYWQFNDETGTTLSDIVGGNHGTLTNMDENDWITSSIPFGTGQSNSQTETAGVIDFTGTGLTMDFNTHNSGEITVTRIDTVPNITPTGADTVFGSQYWVANRFGTGSFNTDLTFAVNEDLTPDDQSNPDLIGLFTRTSTSDANWAFLRPASSVDSVNNEATFDGITGFSQFLVIKMLDLDISIDADTLDFGIVLPGDSVLRSVNITNTGTDTLLVSDISINDYFFSVDTNNLIIPPDTSFILIVTFKPVSKVELIRTLTIASNDPDEPEVEIILVGEGNDPNIELLVSPDVFKIETDNFNSIEVGDQAPTFTDLDGNGLLDLIIGEYDGNLNHYEQDAVNSTSFSLVTENFNSIDVGSLSAPTFTDLDDNGLLDMIIGEKSGNLNHYEQDAVNSTSFSLVTENFNSIDEEWNSAPTFADIDGNGLLDMIMGENYGNLNHYQQNAVNSTFFSLVTNNFNSIGGGFNLRPTFTDLDGNGLLDMIIGEGSGNLNHYQQDTVNSTSFSLVTENFNSIDVGSCSVPTFTDLDGNGLLDMIIGENNGSLNHYEQERIDSLNFGDVLEGNLAIKNYFLIADGLVSDLNIECPEGYKVSLSESAGYVQSLSITPLYNRIYDTIYLRFEPNSTTGYSGYIVHSSFGAATKIISVNGTGIPIVAIDDFAGTALDFDGINDYVRLDAGLASLVSGGTEITIEYWFKGSQLQSAVRMQNAGGYIVAGWGATSPQHIISTDGGTVGVSAGNESIIENDNWHHLAMTWQKNSINGFKSYLDGQLIEQRNSANVYLPSIVGVYTYLGCYDGSSEYMAGILDEVRIWNTALDSTQLRENMYRTLKDSNITGLVAYWQFNEGIGISLSDIIGGNLGTLNNMAEDDWIPSTAPLPFVTLQDGNWENNSTWNIGQNVPIHPWSIAMIKHNITLNNNMELKEMIIFDTNAIMTISTGITLTVGVE